MDASRSVCLAGAAACLLTATSLAAPRAASAQDRGGSADHGCPAEREGRPARGELLWAGFAVPHIYSPDVPTVARGLGYAQVANHAETPLTNVAAARGRSAEHFGAGAGNANVANDIKVHTEGIPRRARDWLDRSGEHRAIIEAFGAGVNEHAARHGATIDPALRRVLPFVPTDVTAGEQNTIDFTFMPEQDDLPVLTAAWQGGIAAAKALARRFTLGGSDGWVTGPRKAALANTILMGRPHPPWGSKRSGVTAAWRAARDAIDAGAAA